jgi:hypothetical protein
MDQVDFQNAVPKIFSIKKCKEAVLLALETIARLGPT